MKVKYLRLSKEEQNKIKNDFYQTNKGKLVKKYTNISIFIGILLILFAIYYSIDTYINHLSKYYYMYSALLVLIAIVFFISIHNLKIKTLNDLITKKKK